MKRSYLMCRPDDDEEDFYPQEAVKAKPIDAHLARNLGPTFAAGKDFVRASQKSQNEFYGNQTVMEASTSCTSGSEKVKEYREMTHDERNNLSASIIKAELKGDKERVEKLKRRLKEGIIEIKSKNGETEQAKSTEKKPVILMEMDRKGGLTRPAVAQNKSNKIKDESRKHIMGVVEEEYSKQSSLDDMLAEEKRTTAEDQISMFNRAAEIFSQNRQDEEGFFDDTLESRKKRRREDSDSQQRQMMVKGGEIFF
uniref:Uncharacterized protein n=1 Tax=Meloidogyne hapla TaxID=6305 RepID=A0A1I8BRR9_MELHA